MSNFSFRRCCKTFGERARGKPKTSKKQELVKKNKVIKTVRKACAPEYASFNLYAIRQFGITQLDSFAYQYRSSNAWAVVFSTRSLAHFLIFFASSDTIFQPHQSILLEINENKNKRVKETGVSRCSLSACAFPVVPP